MPTHESPVASIATTRQTAPFDRDWVLEQIGGDESLLQEIIAVFLDDCPRIEQELADSLAGGQAEAIYAAAHCAKSAVGNFGAADAVAAAITLEQACKEKNETVFVECANALQQELTRLRLALAEDASLHGG